MDETRKKNEVILKAIIALFVKEEEVENIIAKHRARCEKLVEDGIPYNIYLYLTSDNQTDTNHCYLKLFNEKKNNDSIQKLLLKDLVDDIKRENMQYSLEFSANLGGFVNVPGYSRKNSATKRASEEADNYCKEFFKKLPENEREICNELEKRHIYASDIQQAYGKETSYIYPIKVLYQYRGLTGSKNGNATYAEIILGIPFDLN